MRIVAIQADVRKPWRGLVAESRRERARGLLGRDGLEPGVCMVLRPCRLVHTFGMRFALDLLFLDARGRIVKVARGVRPGRLGWGGWRARTTLEAQTGWLPKLEPGERVSAAEGFSF